MSIKSQSRRLGRIIRRATGMHLTVAMKLGRMVAQDQDHAKMADKFPANFNVEWVRCGDGCCSSPRVCFIGPKNKLCLYPAWHLASAIKRENSLRLGGA